MQRTDLFTVHGVDRIYYGEWCCIRVYINNEITFHRKIVANTFNHFFTIIAVNLVAKPPDISGGFAGPFIDTYSTDKKGFFETPLQKHLQNLSSRKVTGLDGMPARFIKDGATQIIASITHIINLSLYSGNVLDRMKITQLAPLYKNSF